MTQHPPGDVPDLSIVVPCYNEEDSLVQLIERIAAVRATLAPGICEVVLVNDGSQDRSWSIIAGFADRCDHVVGVNLARNYGHQLALSAGLQVCRGKAVVVMDADLQDPPELIPAMLDQMAQGYEVIYGQRISRAGETLFKRASASLFYRILQRLVDVPMPADTGDFRLMSRKVVDHLNAMPERYRFVRGMVSWIGFEQKAFPYERDARAGGQSHYPLSRMIGFAIDAVTSFSTLPLRMTAHLGLVAGLVGMMTLGWVLLSWLTGHVVAGWTSLAAIVLLMGSVQLLMLGIFGEYLGRMYMESKRRPLFLIEDIRVRRADPATRAEDESNPVHIINRRLRQALHG